MRQMDAITKGTIICVGPRQRRVLRMFAAPPVGVDITSHLKPPAAVACTITLDRQRAKALLLELPFGSFVRISIDKRNGRSTWYELSPGAPGA